MALDMRLHSTSMTADKIVLSTLSLATSYQARITSGEAALETWPVPIEDFIEEAEEREWDILFAKPHVQRALRRMAAEARQQYYAGETEEGGFAVE